MKFALLKRSSRQSGDQGIVLIECMVYLAVVMVILGLGLNVYLKLLGFHRDLERNSDDISRTTKAGEIWRADIRSARSAIQIDEQADGLLLTIPLEEDSIRYTFRNDTLWRQHPHEQRPKPFLTKLAGCRFTRDSRTYVNAWTWDVKLKTKMKTVRIEPQFSFLAVPSGIERRDEN